MSVASVPSAPDSCHLDFTPELLQLSPASRSAPRTADRSDVMVSQGPSAHAPLALGQGGSISSQQPAVPVSPRVLHLSVEGTWSSPLPAWLPAASPVLRAEKRHTCVPERHRCARATHTAYHLLESWRRVDLGWYPRERQSVA